MQLTYGFEGTPVRDTPSAEALGKAPRRFKPYSAYRDSGVEWLREIPKHWKVHRLKTVASVELSSVDKKSVEGQMPVRLCNYLDVYNNEHITPDLEFTPATATADQVRRFALRAGDVLITKDSESWTDIAVPAVVISDLPDVLCGYHLALVRPGFDGDGAFLSRAFSAVGPRDQFQVAANGITRFGLGGDSIRTGLFAVPPLPEQRAIAAFLDRQTAKIDALVARKERLLDLLQERRSALITRAVTKGLNPTVPMKDSGIEWLGEIPAHWKVRRLKYVVADLTVGIVVTPAKYYVNDGIPCLRSLNISGGKINTDNLVFISPDSNELHRKSKIRTGDILVVRTGQAGAAVIVPPELDGANCIDLLIVRPSKRLIADYLFRFINSTPASGQVEAHSVGAIQAHYNTSTLARLLIPEPPIEEQAAIAEWLRAQVESIDRLVAKTRDAIDRLREYRIALISAAVTGKIDFREDAA